MIEALLGGESSCSGVEYQHSDVSDPFHPRELGSVRIGGIVGRLPHPARPDQPLAGGPQMEFDSGRGTLAALCDDHDALGVVRAQVPDGVVFRRLVPGPGRSLCSEPRHKGNPPG